MAGQEIKWDFLLQQEGDRSWLPLESPDVEILEGRYRVLVRSGLKNADIELRITHEATEEDPPKRRTQRRQSRTNADGLMVVMPFTMLQPGVWELHCGSGLMTDLIGATCQYSVQLHVLPKESEVSGEWEPDWSRPAAAVAPVQSEVQSGAIDRAAIDRDEIDDEVLDEESALLAELGLPEVEDLDDRLGQTGTDLLAEDWEAEQAIAAELPSLELDLGLEPDLGLELDLGAEVEDEVSPEPNLESLLDELEFAPLDEMATPDRTSLEPVAVGESSGLELPIDLDLGDFDLDDVGSDVWADGPAAVTAEGAIAGDKIASDEIAESTILAESAEITAGMAETANRGNVPALPQVEIRLHPDTYERSAGQSLVLAGQILPEPMTDDRSETIALATPLATVDAQVILRDPQTGETVVNWATALPMETVPQDFQLTVPMPTSLSAQLLLGEVVLRDRTSQMPVATQSFTVTAALEDLLASIAPEITPDLLEPTIAPEPSGPDLDLAFLGLVNQGPTVPDLTASPGQTLPPQLKQPSDRESSERKAIELPPLPQPVNPAAETAEPDDILNLFDDDLSFESFSVEGFDGEGLDGDLGDFTATTEIDAEEEIDFGVSDSAVPQVELVTPPPEFFAEFDRTPTGVEGLPDEDLDQLLTEELFQTAPADRSGDGAAVTFDHPFAESLAVDAEDAFGGTFQGWEDVEDATHLEGFDSLDELDAFEEANTIEVTAARLPDEFEALNLDDRFMNRLSNFAEETRAEDAAATPPEPPGPINPFVTPSLGNPEAVSESVVMDDLPIFAVPSLGTDTPENPLKLPENEAVPVPQLEVEAVAEVVAGQPLLVKVKLPNLLPKLYVKLWINDRQTRTLLDGPRYLVDFVPNAQGELESTTQLTVPLGSLEIQLEAITIETATKRESYKTSASLPVVPPNLPDVSFDDFGF
ncbi:hypothetical protein [Alkalinema sp. FACHB-956]|uniref:hypothetical protein n=1 Tax=Alkalinema sp. FACHB-956 TaxID=2692768 RepID=UPI001682D6CA|nr:hypothetical protein [Alkalinema sp. FACHB-956]MBD2326907.1 hypothetical protein [Alkalinema sp. FACHB-956]